MKKIFGLFSAAVLMCSVSVTDADACTTAIISSGASGTGRPLLWKQRDTGEPYNVMAYVTGGRFAYTAVFNASDKKHEEAYAGANEAGFAIMNNASYNLASHEAGDDNGVIMAEALATCVTIDDFETLVKSKPKPWDLEANFGVIDAKGGAAYFEVGDTSVTRFTVEEGSWLVRTNYSFAGREGEGSGFARYDTAHYLTSRHRGPFRPSDLVDGLGRSFYNYELGADMSRKAPNGVAVDLDFIPRFSTTSSICIEGVASGDKSDSSVLWTSIGYTPCCYMVPVWVAAGSDIPSFLTASGNDGRASANELAYNLMLKAHPLDRDAREKYIDFKILRPMMKAVRLHEKTEYKLGHELDVRMRASGFDIAGVRAFNEDAESRFEAFKTETAAFL